MIQYLNNLIPRLKEFSANLDKIEIFTEKPWVIIDDNNNVQKYIFRRNGELIMSLNGQVTVGKWEFLSSAKSLLIDRIQDKILLNQSFIDPAVMILKKDSLFEDNLILANELLLPDLNVIDYLKGIYYQKYKIKEVPLQNGEFLEIFYFDPNIDTYWNKKVAISGVFIDNGVFKAKDKMEFIIKEGKISVYTEEIEYNTRIGKIIIEQTLGSCKIGDKVSLGGLDAPDGKYRLGFMSTITVKDGRIVSS
jgi:hypothetical protein